VYGTLLPQAPPSRKPLTYAPNNPYAASKAASDHLVRAYVHSYDLARVRPLLNNYGPYQFPEKLLPLMITNAIAGKALPVYGDGKQVRDWLYVATTVPRCGRSGAGTDRRDLQHSAAAMSRPMWIRLSCCAVYSMSCLPVPATCLTVV